MTDSQTRGREYNQCYEDIAETLDACEGGIADYNIEEIADQAIVPHPSGTGWMIIGGDDPIDMGEAFWAIVEDNVWPDDHLQDLARVLACEGDVAIGCEQARTVAQEWLEVIPELTTGDLADWLTAGVFTPAAAKELARAGIDPVDLPYPLGYAYTNGDLEIMHVRESLRDII